MATRRLPATPILLFLITVDHQRIYININVRVKRWFRNIKVQMNGINKFMLLLECFMTSSKQIVQQSPHGFKGKRGSEIFFS